MVADCCSWSGIQRQLALPPALARPQATCAALGGVGHLLPCCNGKWRIDVQADELKGRAVVVLSNAEKVGQVDDVLFDAPFRQVLGFRVKKGGLLGKTEALPRESVTSIGADALTVASQELINDETRFAQLAGAATLSKVTGTKVVTESGQLLGTISHLEIDDEAHSVMAYVLSASLAERVMRHQAEVVRASEVIRLGEGGIMIVPDAVGARLQAQQE